MVNRSLSTSTGLSVITATLLTFSTNFTLVSIGSEAAKELGTAHTQRIATRTDLYGDLNVFTASCTKRFPCCDECYNKS